MIFYFTNNSAEILIYFMLQLSHGASHFGKSLPNTLAIKNDKTVQKLLYFGTKNVNETDLIPYQKLYFL
jgi:hypothetical protein